MRENEMGETECKRDRKLHRYREMNTGGWATKMSADNERGGGWRRGVGHNGDGECSRIRAPRRLTRFL